MVNLLLLNMIAHLLADFFFQSDKWCKSKEVNGFRSSKLYLHAGVVFLLSALLSFSADFLPYAFGIAAFHLLTDGLKSLLSSRKNIKGYLFFIDQLIHVVVILGLVYLYSLQHNPDFLFSFQPNTLYYLAGYMLCAKPTNIIIKKIFDLYEIKIENQASLLNAGKLIGVYERILTLTFVLLGRFEAVGFLIAAKSILRYKEGDVKRTEYVLIGTLLSFGIAVLTGIGIEFALQFK